MPKYEIKFRGRKLHAIGIFEDFTEKVDAPDQEAAVAKLYDHYQDVHASVVTELRGKFYMAITRGHGWELVRPTGGQPYEYDTEEEAQRMLATCYPDELRKARLGGPHTVAVLCKRWAITHVNKDGMRTLKFANQGRNHHDTKTEAEKALTALLENNSVDVLGGEAQARTLEVREVLCYSHGDAVGIYFDD